MTTATTKPDPDTQFALALARAFGGAIIFGLPMLMTMEMWSLGAGMPRTRLVLLLVTFIPLLVGLSAISGFERTLRIKHDLLDAFVALAVGMIAATGILFVIGVIGPGRTVREVVGLVTLQAIPGSIGALLAASQFGKAGEAGNRNGVRGEGSGSGSDGGNRDTQDKPSEHLGYRWEMFIMLVGALFLAFNIAPTDEITRIAMQMSPLHTIGAIIISLALMHAFVYAAEFSGQATVRPGTPFASVFLRYTVAGYALALLISAYMLWTFGRLGGLPLGEQVSIVVTMGLPASVGAAAARLLL